MIISIDIGTSYSSMFWLTPDGKTQAVDIGTGTSMFGGKFSLPSAVYAGENGELLIGQAAMNSRKRNPQNFCMEFKRNLGQNFPFLLGDARYLPEDLYTAFYRHMKDCAERAGGEKVKRAYLTFPASFGRAKKEKIQSSARAAGLFDTVLVDEPTAAAMRYRDAGYIKDGQRVLIYDFGGGTFDASLIRYEGGEFRLLAEPAGLGRCGGADIDRLIYQDILEKIDPELLAQLLQNQLHRLRLESQLAELAVKAKHHLSAADAFEEDIPIGFDMVPYQLKRETLDGLIAGMVGNTIACCQKLLEDAELQKGALSAVLLVGGTSRTPLVREMVRRFAGEIPVLHAVDLELAVAEGALGFHLQERAEKEERERKEARERERRGAEENARREAQERKERQREEERAQQESEELSAQQQYDRGEECYNQQSYQEAAKWYRLAAERGHAEAQYSLGVLYKYGRGVKQSTEEALKWYRLAAEQGNAPAQCNLGVLYENGEGAEQSYEEAFKWYRPAAERGSAPAQYNLGLLYENGRGVQQSDTEALKWYKLAAQQGDEDAVAACERLNRKTGKLQKRDVQENDSDTRPANEQTFPEIIKRYLREEAPFQKGAGDFKENSLPTLKRYLKISPEAQVLLAHDDTLFNSGKNGFAITDLGIYCKDFGGTPTFVDWEKFVSGKLTASNPPTNVYINGQVISYYSGGKEEKQRLFNFFTGLQKYLCDHV